MRTENLTLPAPAKINLWLRVHGRRADGYHEVSTRLLRTSLADAVTVTLDRAGDSAVLTCSDETVPLDESNLALKALRAFQRRASVGGAWGIHLEKVIPAGAGLGGGSSNAASVLLAANRLWGGPLTRSELVEVGGEIGADVAFFVLDCPAADAVGRGEKVREVAVHDPVPLVLIKPPFPVSTPWAYSRWKESRSLPGVLDVPQITPWGAVVNDLERPVFARHYFLAALKGWLLEQTECMAALMSGSGSTMFAIARSVAEAGCLEERARDFVGENAFTRVVMAGEATVGAQ